MTKLRDILHVLRNPSGHSDEEVRQVRLEAADLIETTHNILVRQRRSPGELYKFYELSE